MTRRRKRKYPPHPVESFDSFYERMRPIIIGYSFNRRIVGMTPDDVQSEMFLCLWNAWFTFDTDVPNQTLTKRFWAMWTQRRVNLLRYHLAQKRNAAIESTFTAMDFTQEEIEALSPLFGWEDVQVPECPDDDDVAQNVWTLVAHGCTWSEVVDMLGISKRRYYSLIASWRADPEVRMALMFGT